MPHYIDEKCIGCTACVSVCPTEAISGERKQLHYIDPKLCIDCDACVEACPVDACFAEDQLPSEWEKYIQINADYFSNK